MFFLISFHFFAMTFLISSHFFGMTFLISFLPDKSEFAHIDTSKI